MAFETNYDIQGLLYHNLQLIYHYLHEGQLQLYRHLNNLAHLCDEYFSATTLTTWVAVFVAIWSAIYAVYSKLISVILKKMELPALHRNRLSESLWNGGFCVSSIALCTTKLVIHESQMASSFDTNIKSSVAEEFFPAHVLFSCIIIYSFFIHSIILTSMHKGLEAEFFQKGSFIVFLYAAYCLRYIWLGLTLIVLVNICSLCVELMRTCYSLNRGNRARGTTCLRGLTCLLFALHCILWGGVYLYLLPKYYLLPVVNIQVPDENVRTLVVLSAALWGYFWLEICRAPATKLIRYYGWPNNPYGCQDWLDYVLFPPRNDVIEHLKRIRSKARLEKANSLQYDFNEEKNAYENELARKKNSVALFQTVKCVMAMKRKIRKKREAKALAASESQNGTDENGSSSCPSVHQSDRTQYFHQILPSTVHQPSA